VPILVVVVAMLVVITIPIVLMVALVLVLAAVLVFVLVLDIDRTRRGPFAPKAPCAQHCDNTKRYAAHAATVARLVPTLQALSLRR
jgi:hypothetical protein